MYVYFKQQTGTLTQSNEPHVNDFFPCNLQVLNDLFDQWLSSGVGKKPHSRRRQLLGHAPIEENGVGIGAFGHAVPENARKSQKRFLLKV